MILTHLVLFSFLAGAGGAEAPPPAVAETFSGGWGRTGRAAPFETESDEARKARIHAERVKLGILPPDPPETTEGEAADGEISGVPATLVLPDPGLAVDPAGLYAGAWLDQEIKRFFELQDDDDAAVLLLAIAALG